MIEFCFVSRAITPIFHQSSHPSINTSFLPFFPPLFFGMELGWVHAKHRSANENKRRCHALSLKNPLWWFGGLKIVARYKNGQVEILFILKQDPFFLAFWKVKFARIQQCNHFFRRHTPFQITCEYFFVFIGIWNKLKINEISNKWKLKKNTLLHFKSMMANERIFSNSGFLRNCICISFFL